MKNNYYDYLILNYMNNTFWQISNVLIYEKSSYSISLWSVSSVYGWDIAQDTIWRHLKNTIIYVCYRYYTEAEKCHIKIFFISWLRETFSQLRHMFLVITGNHLEITRNFLVITRNYLVITRNYLVITKNYHVITRNYLVITRNLSRNYEKLSRNYEISSTNKWILVSVHDHGTL